MEKFEYTYSAKQEEELEEIRKKYLPLKEDRLAQIRKLDASVTKKATMISISLGCLGMFVFGGGLSLILVVGPSTFLYSIPLGIVGLVLCGSAYPSYNHVLKKERERVSSQILALIDEIKNK